MAKVSVIVPVYKTEDYLCKCLDSLVNQTLVDIEIIVVNDGSPDGSQSIIDRYTEKYPGLVKSLIKENGGLSDARNFGLGYVTGEYIAFVDSDDYVELDAYEKAYRHATEHDLDIVYFSRYDVTSKGRRAVSCMSKRSEDVRIDYILSAVSACFGIFKAEFWLKNDFKFATGLFYEDLELIPRLALYTDKLDYLDVPLYNYIIHDGSIMNQAKYNPKLKSIFTVMENLKKGFEGSGFIEELEFLHIEQLLHSATLRFLPFKEGEKDIAQIVDIIRQSYPKWHKNKYYKQQSWKYRLVCRLAYSRQIFLLKLLMCR